MPEIKTQEEMTKLDITTSQPMFSVIVPAHNAAAHMRRGLDSIRQQSYQDYELIVVCDKCTDDTERIAREYTDIVVPVEYGLDGMARNAGLDAACGQYVLFMDDDDWFLHEYVFAQLADAVGQYDPDVIFFSFIWKGVGYKSQSTSGCYVAVWSKLWKRSFIGKTRFSEKPYWSDVDFHEAMMGKDREARIIMWDMPMYYYNYLRPGSISWRKEQGEIE